MKQVLQPRRGNPLVRDVPSPPTPRGGVLVHTAFSVISAGTERSRVELSRKSLLGKARERPDLVREVVERARREGLRSTREAVERQLDQEAAVGYSAAGVVAEIGPEVRGLSVGDRVACAGGGHANHAEVVSVPSNLCARVPDGVPLELAAMSTIAAIAMHGVRLSEVALGERVAVVGCGLVGQLACRLLAAAGCDVFALDIDESRTRDAARGAGGHGVVVDEWAARRVEELTRGVGVDHVLVTAAAPTNDPLVLASKIVRDRGSIVLVGAVPIEFPRAPLYDKEVSFRVSRSYGPGRYDLDYEERGLDYPIGFVRWTEQRNLESVLDLLARGRLELDDLVDEVIPVADAPRAFARLLGEGGPAPSGAILLSYPTALDAESPASNGEAPAPEGHPSDVEKTEPASDLARASKRSLGTGPVRIGLVGPGGFASRILVPALQAAGARLEVVGGGSGPSAAAAGRGLGFARVAADEQQLIADPQVDAVVVATRHGSHARLVSEALAAGKHVFCEKPLALTVDELATVVEAERSSPGTLVVGFNRRFSPHLRELEGLRRTLGGRLIANYRVSAGRLAPDHWTHDLEQGGGRILGEACHFVDCLRFLAGTHINAVYASGYGPPSLPAQSRDNVAVTLSFADGSVGTIVYAADGSPTVPKERLEVSCGPLTAVLDDYRSLQIFRDARAERRRSERQDKGHRAEIAAFLDGVRTGRAPISPDDLANVSWATLAAVESLRTGNVVEVR